MIEYKERNHKHYAQQAVLRDLVDALLFEDVFGLRTSSTYTKRGAQTLLHYGEASRRIAIPVYFSGLNMYRCDGDIAYLESETEKTPLDAPKLWSVLVDMNPKDAEQLNVVRFEEGLRAATSQIERQGDALALATHPLVKSEQLASWKDRPFHPIAKEKRGLTDRDYEQFQAEYHNVLQLHVVAVHRDYVLQSTHATEQALLDVMMEGHESALFEAMENAHVSFDTHMLFPVHPWQRAHVLPTEFADELDARIIVPLDYTFGAFLSSSSMRSLIQLNQPYEHVKVPISVQSLGAVRLTPTRYMLNGEKAEQLLRTIIDKDAALHNLAYVCDETVWWSFIDEDKDIFKDKIGHLTVQLRQFPKHYAQDDDVQLISMAALAAHSDTLYRDILNSGHVTPDEAALWSLFEDIVTKFITMTLGFMTYGALPELHGQNILVAFKDGRVDGFVLRDHDTVRIYPDWMHARGVDMPEYAVRKDSPNTLINEDLETFFTYFQTLAMSVNVYALVDAFSHVFGLDEGALMAIVRRALYEAVDNLAWNEADRAAVKHVLFEKPTWPFKKIVMPLLLQTGSGGGSMPSSIGTVPNPMMSYE